MASVLEAFDLDTDRTGSRRVISVEVHPSRAQMLNHLEKHSPDVDWRSDDPDGPSAAFVTVDGFHTDDTPEKLGTIFYSADHLDIGTLVHEVVHAAMWVYEVDLVGTYSRATAHMTVTNETIAYIVDRLMGQLAGEMLDRGLYDDVLSAV